MTSISSLNSAALLNLQQSKPLSVSHNATVMTSADTIVTAKDAVDHSKRSEADSALDYWGVLTEDVTKLELDLIEKLGTEFGIYQDDYDSINAYGEAIRVKVAEIRSQPLGFLTITEIESNLRLNDLGITLDALIEIVSNPLGNAESELDIVLEKQAAEQPIVDGSVSEQGNNHNSSFKIDENGIYSLLR